MSICRKKVKEDIKKKLIADKIAKDSAKAKEEEAIADAIAKLNGENKRTPKPKLEKKENRKKRKALHKAEQRAEIEKRKSERKASEEGYF